MRQEKKQEESLQQTFSISESEDTIAGFTFWQHFLARRECRAREESGKLEIDLFALDLYRVNRLPSVNGLHIALPVLIQKRP